MPRPILNTCTVFVLFLLIIFSPSGAIPADETPIEIDLLKKLGSHSVSNAIQSSKTLDEAAVKLGLSVDELRVVCRVLSIDLSVFEKEEVTEKEKEETMPAETSMASLISDGLEPEVIMDYNCASPYVILVEKKFHKLYLLKYEKGKKTIAGVFECKTGKNRGDKKKAGDHKTPEGIYYFVTRYNRDQIETNVGKANAFQYGDMAFVTDFPNAIDGINGKNGGGIWLHGTDEDFAKTSYEDTRGCVVTTNETIQFLSKYIKSRKTPMIIVETLTFIDKRDHDAEAQNYLTLLDRWRSAWQEKRLDDYIGYYSERFTDRGKDLAQYKSYKESIFTKYTINHVNLDGVSILKYNNGLIVQFTQDYSAENLSSVSLKTLYIIYERDSWRIIAEKIQK